LRPTNPSSSKNYTRRSVVLPKINVNVLRKVIVSRHDQQTRKKQASE
jgi:hypothetical protein